MSFTTGLAVPLFLFIASLTCDLSFGQNLDSSQAFAGSFVDNGMGYNSDGGFGSAAAASGSSWSQGFNGGLPDAGPEPGNRIGGFYSPPGPADGGFVRNEGSAAVARASSGSVVNNWGPVSRPQTVSFNRGLKPVRVRTRKLSKPTIFSGGFSWRKIFPAVKNVFTSCYSQVLLPDSQRRIAKWSSFYQLSGFSFRSMYQMYFTLYNDISQTNDDMNFFQVGVLALMEMAFGMWNFLKSTPFACMIDVAQSFDYVSLMYSFMGRMGCDSLCVAKWMTKAMSVLS